MSSILKALKRIEEESPPAESFPSLPASIDAKQAVNSKARRRWLSRRLMTVFLILLVIVVTAVILYSQRQLFVAKISPTGPSDTKKKTIASLEGNSKVFRAEIPPPSAKKVTGPSKQTGKVKKNVKPTVRGDNAKKNRVQANTATPRARVGQRKPEAYSSSQNPRTKAGTKYKKPQKKRSPLTNKSTSDKQIARRSPAPQKSATRLENSNRSKTYDRLHSSNLKLQALAWFSDATKRMAVINDRIVREGESVDGYQINQIRREDVIVNDGKKSWSLEFGLKQ